MVAQHDPAPIQEIEVRRDVGHIESPLPDFWFHHSHRDAEFAAGLRNDLERLGIRVIQDPLENSSQDPLFEFITQQTNNHRNTAYLVSENSVSAPWLVNEIRNSLLRDRRHGVRATLLLISGLPVLPREFDEAKRISFSPSYENGLRDLTAYLARDFTSNESTGPSLELPKHVISEEHTDDNNRVFVICSFVPEMDAIFRGMVEAGRAHDLILQRVKDIEGDYKVNDEILAQIHEARLIIADLSFESPNVYFELGYARALGKTVITVARTGTKVHFNVMEWTCIFYGDSRELEDKLRTRFKRRFEI